MFLSALVIIAFSLAVFGAIWVDADTRLMQHRVKLGILRRRYENDHHLWGFIADDLKWSERDAHEISFGGAGPGHVVMMNYGEQNQYSGRVFVQNHWKKST